MRSLILLPILLAARSWCAPVLPEVAAKVPVGGCRIRLEWVSSPAGTIAPPRTVAGTLEFAGDRFLFRSSELSVASDGAVIRQWNPSTSQFLVRPASKVPSTELPSSLLLAALSGSELSCSRERLDGKPSLRLALGTTRPPLSRYARATLWARESDRLPLKLEVEDAAGGTVSWKLLSVQPWKPSAKDFDLSVPKGAEVVDLR